MREGEPAERGRHSNALVGEQGRKGRAVHEVASLGGFRDDVVLGDDGDELLEHLAAVLVSSLLADGECGKFLRAERLGVEGVRRRFGESAVKRVHLGEVNCE